MTAAEQFVNGVACSEPKGIWHAEINYLNVLLNVLPQD
jgi:predicted glycosyl hydrolase (DUF1957 family)